MSEEADFGEVIKRELRIIDLEVRRDERLIRELLHPDFLEFGASGRVWDTDSIVQALITETDPQAIEAYDFEASAISTIAILLTFRCKSGGRETLRSSVWLKSEKSEWLLRFHQATIVGDR